MKSNHPDWKIEKLVVQGKTEIVPLVNFIHSSVFFVLSLARCIDKSKNNALFSPSHTQKVGFQKMISTKIMRRSLADPFFFVLIQEYTILIIFVHFHVNKSGLSGCSRALSGIMRQKITPFYGSGCCFIPDPNLFQIE